MIKLICIDVDGTLIDNNWSIPKRNLEIVSKAIKNGIRVSIISGRIFQSARDFMDILGADGPVSSYGGCLLEERNGRVIDESFLDRETALSVNEIAKKYKMTMIAYKNHNWYADSLAEKKWIESEYKASNVPETMVDDLNDIIRETEPTKFLAINENLNLLDEFDAEINRKLYGKIRTFKSWPQFLEVVPPDADKGKAVRSLRKYFGFEKNEVMAIGDFDNDIPMMLESGLSVAVANATQNVKDVASFVTEADNNNNAVAEAIERFAFSQVK